MIKYYGCRELAYFMNKSVDWCPSINLGHGKINVDALKVASDRAEWTVFVTKKDGGSNGQYCNC